MGTEKAEPLKSFFMMSLNFGDKLGPYLIEKITGRRPVFVPKESEDRYYVTCGSILNHAGPNSVVWGAGLGSLSDQVNSSADLKAVRGPFSGFRAGMCGNKDPKVYGDPAMLLAKFIPKSQHPKSYIGIVPHYVDQARADYFYGDKPEYKIVDILGPIEQVVEDITSCSLVVSTSLHGLVVADAYGIPNIHAVFDDNIGGDGMKFSDHKSSGGKLQISNPVDVRDGVYRPEKFWRKQPSDPMEFNSEPLWERCPFK